MIKDIKKELTEDERHVLRMWAIKKKYWDINDKYMSDSEMIEFLAEHSSVIFMIMKLKDGWEISTGRCDLHSGEELLYGLWEQVKILLKDIVEHNMKIKAVQAE